MSSSLISKLNSVFPKLSNSGQKGQNGRVGVIGGSYEFTGAPFYSAISALKVGGDIAHIFCSKSSSISIKSYSPEIIVHPVFVSEEEEKIDIKLRQKMYEEWIHKIGLWEKAIHSWVIGPGLGRDLYMSEFFPRLLRNVGKGKVVVIDADGIFYLSQYPQLFQYLSSCNVILTPNKKQLAFIRPFLSAKTLSILDSKIQRNSEIEELAYKQLDTNFTFCIKGDEDLILGPKSFLVGTEGGIKRCGGIGDILAGVTAVCSLWDATYGPVLASRIVRKATKKAFDKEGRGLTAPSIIRELSHVVIDMDRELK